MRETILILIISQTYLIEFLGEMVTNIIKKKQIRILCFYVAKFSEEGRVVHIKQIQYLISPEQCLLNLHEEKNNIFPYWCI